jgi:GNAT superfamily N-acetyltransferase
VQQMNADRFEIVEGAIPGALDRVVAMHAGYYGREHGMGEVFERKVAEGLREFLPRALRPRNRLWLATTVNPFDQAGQTRQNGQIVGSIAIDGEDLGAGQAHLRWFILDDGCRGQGVGAALLRNAVEFVEAAGFDRTVLWTFKGLDAARHLYEREGFLLVEEYAGAQWGVSLMEQRFVRERGGVQATGLGVPG